VLFAFVALGSLSFVLSQKIGWEERLRNDLFYAKWDVTRYSILKLAICDGTE